MNKFLMMLMMSTMICRPDDGAAGGSGGGADDKGAGDKGGSSMIDAAAIAAAAADPNKAAADAAAAAAAEAEKAKNNNVAEQPGQKATRPDWLKEDKFWDAEKGEVKSEDILKSYKELEAKFSRGDHKTPAKAEDYKITLTDEQKTTLFGAADADASKDPYMQGLLGWAAKNKVNQDGVNELLGIYHDLVAPEAAKLQIDIVAEKAVLGKNADAVIKNQMDFFTQLYKSGHINDKHLSELQILGETAAGIQAIQKIREYYGEQPIPTNMVSQDGMPTKAELSAMLNDPKYDTDTAHKAKVDALYAKMYGTAPAMSSAQNR